ncbi:hypothetical protein FISHEDRAFT_46946 [Fistulina hepatica ATCC 64428]|uniref:BTB domain-containing protein n=1 Tax=Fistulina hepatica ATCC 64428 TaxID=1128425 RepID=A0A0D7A8F0_9AGAR|nr:hypothetical protein FISHEDRAFT_46946 [Fistulina hepatica ATCC 64428]
MSTALAPPSLQEATKSSTDTWHQHLELLFHEAKDRFPDVVWELVDDEDKQHVEAEVWGHKAMVYARAPPNFQTRYFNRGNPSSASILGASTFSFDIPDFPRTPSPMSAVLRSTSPAPSGQGASSLLRLTTTINPTLFSNELGYLYTGKGFGEAFEFLFDAADASGDSEMDAEEMRLDKLRKDLVYMWRSRLYSDVKISLTGVFSSSNHEATTAIFSVHRFILVSRCEYFHHVLVGWPNKPSSDTLTLPSPPFTPASLHFALGFIYTGTLIFSNRTYDLDTAFAILRSATYLSLQTLYDEIQARIVQEMMHGLFHAFLEFSEYESLTNGKWGTGGCRCRQCARRAPRVLQFAISDDVKNMHLDRGARRALVGLFGEGWVTSEFAELPQKIRDGLLKGVGKRTTPENAFALLYAAHHALTKLSNISAPWTNVVKEMILEGQKTISRLFCSNGHQCFAQEEWMEIMRNDGVGFADSEKVDWVMAAVQRGLSDRWAPMTYQTLVSDILLHPHPTEVNAAMLSQRSIVRVKVEAARMGVLKYIRQHWMNIRTAGGFDDLEGWAIKEISDCMFSFCVDLSAATDSTVVGSIKRRLSTETIKKSIFPTVPEPKGATLEIGIPCIITSKRKRFKAFARYIGEVEGEDGPWVGVEVPIPGGGDHWGSDSDSTSGTPDPASIPYDRQWHDGTWGGIRYFELGGHGGSDWDYYGDDSMSRAARRRRIDASGSSFLGKGARRDARRFRSSSPTGSDASYLESRGLFVRPQQVLYVVDAVGPDV